MEDLIINSTHSTPDVIFKMKEGVLKIAGICTPENPKTFFEPIGDKLSEFQGVKQTLEIEFFLDYFNSGSSKAIMNLLVDASKKIANLNVKWLSSDEELRDSGEILEEITKVKFEFVDLESDS